MNKDYLKLCLITSFTSSTSIQHYEEFVLAAIRGGVTSIQIREKKLSFLQLKHFAKRLQTLLNPYNIPLIINDEVELAKAIDADGVHLGQSDISPMKARKILGDNKIIGLSIESLAEVRLANQIKDINYIAASAVFKSKSKQDCKTLWGIVGLQQVTQLSSHPVIAIGGINLANVEEVMQCSVTGIAVISAIHDAADPERMAIDLINKINHVKPIKHNE